MNQRRNGPRRLGRRGGRVGRLERGFNERELTKGAAGRQQNKRGGWGVASDQGDLIADPFKVLDEPRRRSNVFGNKQLP